jgi:hypothetical protein
MQLPRPTLPREGQSTHHHRREGLRITHGASGIGRTKLFTLKMEA